jgi:hypothetical protein
MLILNGIACRYGFVVFRECLFFDGAQEGFAVYLDTK